MERLVELRTLRGLKQIEVADSLGVQRTTYVKWERGNSQPSIEMLCRLADFFGVSIDYIVMHKQSTHSQPSAFPLSGSEQQLLGYYRAVNQEGQHHILDSAENTASNSKYRKQDSSNLAI